MNYHRHVLLTWFLIVLSIGLPDNAESDPRVRYQDLLSVKAGYDYAPSILWDGSRWVMYTCGHNELTGSDGIFRSHSSNGTHWTLEGDPTLGVPASDGLVLKIASAPAWDSGHVCDPTVLQVPIQIDGTTYQWAMWYGAIPLQTSTPPEQGPGRIGLAVSQDGIQWTRYSGNPVVDCGSATDIYGCGQPSVVKKDNTYYMSHTRIVHGGTGDIFENQVRTSADGTAWTLQGAFTYPDNPATHEWPDVGPDFVYSELEDKWYSVVNTSQYQAGTSPCPQWNNWAYDTIRVYRSDSMLGEKTLVGVLELKDITPGMTCNTEKNTERWWLAEQGFYRDAVGHLPKVEGPRRENIWFAFGQGTGWKISTSPPDVWIPHSPDEEIKGAKLAILDAEAGLDGLLGGGACSPGPTISVPQFAWNADGPMGDDVLYWTVTADTDGIDGYCDIRLQISLLPNVDFSAGTRLEVTWVGVSNTPSDVGMNIFLLDSGLYTYLGLANGVAGAVHTHTFLLPASRSNVQEILFRVQESFFTDLVTSGAQTTLLLGKVRLRD